MMSSYSIIYALAAIGYHRGLSRTTTTRFWFEPTLLTTDLFMQWMHIGATQPPLKFTFLEPSPSFGSLGFKGPCRDHFVELKRISAFLAYEIRLGSAPANLVDVVGSGFPPLVASTFRRRKSY
ncbi:hypothetical protein CcaverHIS002_0104450 [Cutaneotrichosporon cavernicola]|uniref:Uncharacterized protein n=1 Tax=Cutaneotrichosporon cavernicola TaxID=279322 RepID=A0AA48IBD9_9TREE|nr:uncharacterized protein CcaverHIS019_0104390 [Cutaneotrichosporon cavernicola]BEI79916.1 hypothetical protein CcaverHIS002_0104450 [Cutaneotrichosporon cavernicola]BEI87721.1 hypothetical protein CcaverHIS019_0104390 [Cutaneotrichosporon cavernicola]BEI95492.1 hypothetical protein CcaverHIS631_0104410 [Cutaneotrichosporon cavernicola]BEJ03266.1 hypothetical protein CcaverHIS641_0104410 [Cutaneotrichosporon cavernicola]